MKKTYGELFRDQGITRVIESHAEWYAAAHRHAIVFLRANTGKEIIGEDIRMFVQSKVGAPRSPNAWGALIRDMGKLGLIRPTGRLAQMKDARSHARRSLQYIVM